MLATRLLLAATTLVFALGCDSDSSDPASSSEDAEDRTFALMFNTNNCCTVEATLTAYFTTGDLSTVPEVVVNGDTLGQFYFGGAGLECYEQQLPYAHTLEYSVSAGGDTTRGSIDMPAKPYGGMVNQILMNLDDMTYIDSVDTYEFSWNCDSYDSFTCGWGGWDYTEVVVDEPRVSFAQEGVSDYEFWVSANRGARLRTGGRPSVHGNYGSGYVAATSEGAFYFLAYRDYTGKPVAHGQDPVDGVAVLRDRAVELLRGGR